MHLGKYCPGCGGGFGNQSCAIAKCSLKHDQVEYCFQCRDFPCSLFDGAEDYDSFITHQKQLADLARAQKIGITAYNEEQVRKSDILMTLLSQYDDGRRKTFYCVAINLLPLPDIEIALQQVADHLSADNLTIKEKADLVALQFQALASQQGVELKLRKKKKA